MKLNKIKSIQLRKGGGYDYFVRWDINHICNFNCWFCSQGKSNKHTFNKSDIDHYNNQAYEIADELNKELSVLHDKSILINILGGEPTLSDLPGVIDYIQPGDNKIKFKITTNFSCPDEYCDRLINVIKNSKNKELEIIVSVHQTEIDTDIIVERIKKYIEYVGSVVMVIFDWESYYDYIQLKDEIGRHVTPQLCFDHTNGKILLPQEIIDKIDFKYNQGKWLVTDINNNKDYYERYELLTLLGGKQIPNFKGMKCYGYTKILCDGTKRHCQYEMPSKENKILELEPRICNIDCYCNLCYPVKLEASDDN